jgi:transcription elongation factor
VLSQSHRSHESDYTGAQTPLLGASRTPAWSDMGGRTPAHEGDGLGGWTPARSQGSATPVHDVWNPRTPHHNPRTPQAADTRVIIFDPFFH